MNTPKYLIVHHTGGTDANPLQDSSSFTFEQCDELHKQRFNFKSSLGYYVGYQYYISKDGTIKQARADDEEGAHTLGQNFSSLGICLAGNFDVTDPTSEQIVSLTKILKEKSAQYGIPANNIFPHRHFASKTCYGNRLADNWASLLTMTRGERISKASNLLIEAASFLKGII